MGLIKNISTARSYETIEITHLIYEKNDDGLMMVCKVENNGKQYYTNVSVNFSQFNTVIDNLLKKGIDITEIVAEKLFNAKEKVADICLSRLIGKPVEVDANCLVRNVA